VEDATAMKNDLITALSGLETGAELRDRLRALPRRGLCHHRLRPDGNPDSDVERASRAGPGE